MQVIKFQKIEKKNKRLIIHLSLALQTQVTANDDQWGHISELTQMDRTTLVNRQWYKQNNVHQ